MAAVVGTYTEAVVWQQHVDCHIKVMSLFRNDSGRVEDVLSVNGGLRKLIDLAYL